MFKRISLLSSAGSRARPPASRARGRDPARCKGPFAGAVHAVGRRSPTWTASQQTWTVGSAAGSARSRASSITLTRRDKTQVTFTITSSTSSATTGADATASPT